MLDWTIWPAASMINFYYVKMEYRVLYVSCVSIVWNAILSYLAYEWKYEYQTASTQNKFKACQYFNIMIFTLHYYFIKSNQDSIFIPYLKTNKIIRSNTHKKISGS